VPVEIAEGVLSRQIDNLEPILTRPGCDVRTLADQFNASFWKTGQDYLRWNPTQRQHFAGGTLLTKNLLSRIEGWRGTTAHIVTWGQTPMLDPDEAGALHGIDVSTHAGLRDCALIGPMIYFFDCIGAALGGIIENIYMQNRQLWMRLREKGANLTRCLVITL
jgi:hypothetical protein